VYYLFIKKFLKKSVKRGLVAYTSRKYWIFFRPNLVLSKKSKNSRMGKGKGAVLRRAFRSRVWSPLIEFKGFNLFTLKSLQTYLIFKTRMRIVLCVDPLNNRPTNHITKQQTLKFFFKKYHCI
jgi:hypothetical protein